MLSNHWRCVLTGLGCVAIAFVWQFLTVHFNYDGRWNALFSTGQNFPQPPALSSERLFVFPGPGYDGEMYHYIAHDPFLRRGFSKYMDAPALRYRRILIPFGAYVLALGRDEWVDGAYIGIILLAIFCGGYWLSLYFSRAGFGAALGLAFLLIPATLTSIDRMTVDVGLAALCIAFVLLVAHQSRGRLYAVLAAAMLVRETGLLLIVGYVLWLLWTRHFRSALFFSTAAIPALAWYAFIEFNLKPRQVSAFSLIPFRGLAEQFANPYHYAFPSWIAAFATVLDYAALAGVVLAIAFAIRMAWERLAGPIEFSVYCFAVLAVFLYAPGAWREVYAFGRTLSPLLVLLALYGVSKRQWIGLLPLLLIVPRTAIQLAPQAIGIFRKIF